MESNAAVVDSTAWGDLEGRAAEPGSLNARRLANGGGAVIAVDYQRRRHVLLPLRTLDDGFTDGRSRGLVVQPRMLEVEDERLRPFLDLCSPDAAGREGFDFLALDLSRELANGL